MIAHGKLKVKNYDRNRQSSDETDCSTSSKKRKNMKGNEESEVIQMSNVSDCSLQQEKRKKIANKKLQKKAPIIPDDILAKFNRINNEELWYSFFNV